MTNFQPTPYPEVNDLLGVLLSEVQQVLGENFAGMYLYGSLALGDFSTNKSDIDFVVATHSPVTAEQFAALEAMHRRIGMIPTKWATELEGSYISLAELRRYDPNVAEYPHIDRSGSDLLILPHHSDWVIQRHSLREYGVTLAGPPVRDLIDPISPDDLRKGVLDMLWWWQQQADEPTELHHGGYQDYAVLTMCRILYTLENGAILSKPAAGQWALEQYGSRFGTLIRQALDWRNGEPFDHLDETVGLIRFMLERASHFR